MLLCAVPANDFSAIKWVNSDHRWYHSGNKPVAGMRKYSVSLKGHKTSYSLEPEFHQALCEIATGRAVPVAAVVAELDRSRGDKNLSSAIRLFVLAHFKGRAG